MSKTTAGTARPVYRIRKDGQGMGNFLALPGHPSHEYVLLGYWPRGNRAVTPSLRKEPDMYASIETALASEDIPPEIRDQARRILDRAQPACTEEWLRFVYGHYRNCYAPDDDGLPETTPCVPPMISRMVRTGPPRRHLGYLTVREYFPDHEPRLDLIAAPDGNQDRESSYDPDDS